MKILAQPRFGKKELARVELNIFNLLDCLVGDETESYYKRPRFFPLFHASELIPGEFDEMARFMKSTACEQPTQMRGISHPPSQHTLSTYPLNTLSTYPLNTLVTHSHTPWYTLSPLHSLKHLFSPLSLHEPSQYQSHNTLSHHLGDHILPFRSLCVTSFTMDS